MPSQEDKRRELLGRWLLDGYTTIGEAISEAGFVLAPREPTQVMKIAGLKPYMHNVPGIGLETTPADIYKAMIAAIEAGDD